jgi:long-chain-fatty-acid--[acyl-carrier-protein] ligase
MLLLRYLMWLLIKLTLSLRYRIRIHGTDKLKGLQGPVLILPNHPGYTDPIIVLISMWPMLRPRPVLYEEYFRHPLLYPVAQLLRAVRIPDLERASVHAKEKAARALTEVTEGLKRGENFVMWPAGHIQHDGVERLGGARAAADILQAVPAAKVVLVRTRGVWGSMFSFAPTGERPNLIRTLWKGLGLLLANLFVFMPRRSIDLTIEPIDRSALPEPRREVLNPWLEAWYNADGPEKPVFVPYHRLFGRRTYQYPEIGGTAAVDVTRIRPETRAAVAEILGQRLGRELTSEEQKPEMPFDRLGLDSLDRMEVTLAVERQFGFHGDDVPSNLGQLWALAEGIIEHKAPKPPPQTWFQPPSDDHPLEVLGETIAEGFVARALTNPRDVAAADDLAGVLTYERLLVGVLSLSRSFKQLPAAHVGVLLPASVACDLVFLALHLAGKLPVLLNWTTGPANLAHAARLMELTEVVTSRAFVDRSGINIEGVRYLFLEELRKQTGKFKLLLLLLTVRHLPGRIRAAVPRIAPDQPAVVLFTSGSERAPKAVPLTHTNIFSVLRAGIPVLGLTRREVLLGFLPAFHSLGLLATSIYPLLTGMRVVHHPDPTDAFRLARKAVSYRTTFMVGTPTFINYIMDRAQPGELASLRLIIVGAEKCPKSLFDKVARLAPQATLAEGYGITECSAVVAANPPAANQPGMVGPPLPGIDVQIVDLETEEELPTGKMGMVWVSGPIVFPGYLGFDGPSPFRQRQGKRWYVTGDLAEMGADRYLRLAGRLKRFLKAGGEMISLPALEEPLTRRFPPSDEGPRVAVEGIESDGGRRIVLFTTERISLQEANALLLQEGFHGVMRLDEVRKVERIPVLGTGKTDYKVLRAQIELNQALAQRA